MYSIQWPVDLAIEESLVFKLHKIGLDPPFAIATHTISGAVRDHKIFLMKTFSLKLFLVFLKKYSYGSWKKYCMNENFFLFPV